MTKEDIQGMEAELMELMPEAHEAFEDQAERVALINAHIKAASLGPKATPWEGVPLPKPQAAAVVDQETKTTHVSTQVDPETAKLHALAYFKDRVIMWMKTHKNQPPPVYIDKNGTAHWMSRAQRRKKPRKGP